MVVVSKFRSLYGRGERGDYALEPAPIGSGGQADVFRASHKPSGLIVAFKRLRANRLDDIARMRREIEVGGTISSPHIMPVLDAATDSVWFVMPFAPESLETGRGFVAGDVELREVVEQVSVGLRAAHDAGYVHRDLKPSNILRYRNRWIVSDWGLVRRPPGLTSRPTRTAPGQPFGTEGFAAPELLTDPHNAGPAADIYSLGQIVGWAVTSQWPIANVPLLPPAGPWRAFVRFATQLDASKRPQSVDQVMEVLDRELADPVESSFSKGSTLLDQLRSDDASADALLKLALDNPADYDLHIDILPQMSEADVTSAVRANPDHAREVAISYLTHVEGDWSSRSFDWANAVIRWLLRVARTAVGLGEVAVLEAATESLLEWDAIWDRWNVQKEIRAWMRGLAGEPARVVASLLRIHGASARHFESLADDLRVDSRIRSAVQVVS